MFDILYITFSTCSSEMQTGVENKCHSSDLWCSFPFYSTLLLIMMLLASYRSPISSFSLLPLILPKSFYYVTLNPRGFHTFPWYLNLLITNSKSSFLPTAAEASADSPLGVWGVFALFFLSWELYTLGKRFIFGSWCECRGCTSGVQELGVSAEDKAHSAVVLGAAVSHE